MVKRTRSENRPIASVELHRQYVLEAELEPDVTEALLDACPLFSLEPGQLSAAFLLEVASVVVLRSWEERGLRIHLDVDLPSYHEAAEDFTKRAARGPTGLGGSSGADLLFTRLLNVYLHGFACDGRAAFGADVLLGDIDENEFVDVIAEFLWSRRNELSRDCPATLPTYDTIDTPQIVPDYQLLNELRSED